MCSQPVVGAGWNDRFWHLDPAGGQPAPMWEATRYQLTFRLTPHPEDKAAAEPMLLASRAFHARSLLATIRVRFIGPAPRSIWTYDGASPFARPQAASRYNRTHLDTHQQASLVLRDVHGGLFSGFGWGW